MNIELELSMRNEFSENLFIYLFCDAGEAFDGLKMKLVKFMRKLREAISC